MAAKSSSGKTREFRVGYLWDSLSPNTGDRAIGKTFLRLAKSAGLETVSPVRIGDPIRDSYDLLVIGGGELLQPPGNPFYDVFRAPGRHILNTVGTSRAIEAEFLNDYSYVSVRSQRDFENLTGFTGQASIAPCLTVLFDTLVQPEEAPAVPADSVGLHVHPASVMAGDMSSGMTALHEEFGGRVVLFPFTFYNRDALIEEVLAELFELPAPLPIAGPDAAFKTIGQFRAVVTSSLHATIMAYVLGVPFLAFAYADKVKIFLEDRDLASRQLSRPEEIADKLDLLQPDSVDWEDSLSHDRSRARQVFEDVLAEIDECRTRDQDAPNALFDLWREPTHPKSANEQILAIYSEYGERIGETQRFRSQLAKLESWVGELTSLSEQAESELQRTSRHCQDLEASLVEHKTEMEEAQRYQRTLEDEIQKFELAHKTEREKAQTYQKTLEDEIEEHHRAQENLRSHAESLQSELDRAARYANQISSELAAKQTAIDDRSAQVEKLLSHQESLAQYVDKVEKELQAKQVAIDEGASHARDLEARISEYDTKSREMHERETELERRLDEMRARLVDREAAIERRDAELDRIHSSLLWRFAGLFRKTSGGS